MIKSDPSLEPDLDEDNINHIAVHGIPPEQVEEVYYSEGPFPTLARSYYRMYPFLNFHPKISIADNTPKVI